jgi:hypothetical protein
MLGDCLFVLSFLVSIQFVAASVIDPFTLVAPCEDLISGRVIYNIPGFIGFSMLWLGSRGLGMWEFLSSSFDWSFLVVKGTFSSRGGKKCNNGVAQDEEEVPVSELPGGC